MLKNQRVNVSGFQSFFLITPATDAISASTYHQGSLPVCVHLPQFVSCLFCFLFLRSLFFKFRPAYQMSLTMETYFGVC